MLSSLGVQQHANVPDAISKPTLPPSPDQAFVAPPSARQVANEAELEAIWKEGNDWILGRWQYSEEEQEKLRKQRAKDAEIRSEVRRLNEEAMYEPISCVPLSKSAIAFLDYLEAAAAPDAAAAACDVPPTPKSLPPSAPPPPTQAQAASEGLLSVNGARRSSTPKS